MTGLDPVSAGGAMAAGSVLNTIIDIGQGLRTAHSRMKPASLTDFTAIARVEPLCIVDSDCAYLPELPDILQSLNSQFTGFYLQAVSLVADVGNIKVAKILDKLNPNRKPDVAAFVGNFAEAYAKEEIVNKLGPEFNWKMAAENYKWRLPSEGNTVAMEAEILKPYFEPPKPKEVKSKPVDDKTMLSLQESINLSVGKQVNVTITSNGHTLTLPISVRLIVTELPKPSLMGWLGDGLEDKSFGERLWKWREGRISFWGDLVFSLDLLKKHKKAIMNDREGVLTEIARRNKANAVAGFMSKNPSLNNTANLFVISEETSRELESRYDLRMDDFNSRSKLFEHTAAMIVAVVDREAERVRFYTRDIRLATSLGYRDIRNANKGGGPDIAEILNAYKKGEAPSF